LLSKARRPMEMKRLKPSQMTRPINEGKAGREEVNNYLDLAPRFE
jgi:hypothetical protein